MTSILRKRDFQRRQGLRQSTSPESLMEHRHSVWTTYDISLVNAGSVINTVGYTPAGMYNLLHPIPIMFAISAELIMTTTFTHAAETFTVKLNVGPRYKEFTYTGNSSFVFRQEDISDLILVYFRSFREERAHIEVKVSNAASPARINGAFLRFHIYQEDTFGDYATPLSQLIIDRSDINKDLIGGFSSTIDDFQYLSGIRPR